MKLTESEAIAHLLSESETSLLERHVKVLGRALKFSEKYAEKVGQTNVIRGGDGSSHIRKAREAVQGIQHELQQLDNKWNGMLL